MKLGNTSIKIALIDDHILLRDALTIVINSFDDCTVISGASNGKEFISSLNQNNLPNIVILDVNMPEMDGYDTAKWLLTKHPEIHIIILTMFNSETALLRLLKLGVKAFLKKDTQPKELEQAINAVSSTGFYYSQDTSGKLASVFHNPGRNFGMQSVVLTENEINFLKLASSEMTYKEIAKQLYISPRTVDNYRDQLFDKLNIKSRVGLAMFAIKNGIVNF
jgi:two-component system, NarL family, invasion response regulator UvrY